MLSIRILRLLMNQGSFGPLNFSVKTSTYVVEMNLEVVVTSVLQALLELLNLLLSAPIVLQGEVSQEGNLDIRRIDAVRKTIEGHTSIDTWNEER